MEMNNQNKKFLLWSELIKNDNNKLGINLLRKIEREIFQILMKLLLISITFSDDLRGSFEK